MFTKIVLASLAAVLLATPSVALAKSKKGSADGARAFAQAASVRPLNQCLVASHAVIGPNGNVIACDPDPRVRSAIWTDYLSRSGK